MSSLNLFLLGIFVTSLSALLLKTSFFAVLAVLLFIYFTVYLSLYYRKKGSVSLKYSKDRYMIERLKIRRQKEELKKHKFIEEQIDYISQIWDLSHSQKRVFEKFIKNRAYSDLYSKMTSSLLPQLITMIELCIQREKKGCKRDVQSRINRLVAVMKEEIGRKRVMKKIGFETTKDVYDHLLSEVEDKIKSTSK